MGMPQERGKMLFLCSDAGAFVTGHAMAGRRAGI